MSDTIVEAILPNSLNLLELISSRASSLLYRRHSLFFRISKDLRHISNLKSDKDSVRRGARSDQHNFSSYLRELSGYYGFFFGQRISLPRI